LAQDHSRLPISGARRRFLANVDFVVVRPEFGKAAPLGQEADRGFGLHPTLSDSTILGEVGLGETG